MATAYQTIKNLEGLFPIPTPYLEVKVGTFNASTGQFQGKVSTTEIMPPDESHRKPWKKQIPPETEANAVNVGLIFEVKNRRSTFVVVANGKRTDAGPGKSKLVVDVGKATRVTWKVTSGTKSYGDNLLIKRPPIVGVGAFTIPALPIALIYEPPQDSKSLNKASYSAAKSIGTTVKMSFREERSTTTAMTTSEFSGIPDLKLSLTATAKLIKWDKFPGAEKLSKLMTDIAEGLGDASGTQTAGTGVSQDHALQVKDVAADKYETTAHLGPGRGDLIIFVRNAKLAWLAHEGKLTLTLLDRGGTVMLTLEQLRTVGLPDLPADVLQALVALDPFAVTPRAVLPQERFSYEGNHTVGNLHYTHTASHEISESDLNATTSFGTKVEDYRTGWLSFIGIGVTEDKNVKASQTHTCSNELATGEKVEAQIDLYGQADEVYCLDRYYDRVFGTFALQSVPLGPQVITGTVQDASGRPLAGQVVALEVSGKRFAAVTDQQGHYSIHASKVPAGAATLTMGGKAVKTWKAGATGRLDGDIRLPR